MSKWLLQEIIDYRIPIYVNDSFDYNRLCATLQGLNFCCVNSYPYGYYSRDTSILVELFYHEIFGLSFRVIGSTNSDENIGKLYVNMDNILILSS